LIRHVVFDRGRQILRADRICRMQIPHTHRVGDLVVVRRARWRIVEVRTYDECQMVTLCGLSPPLVGVERRVLTPFDTIERREPELTPRPVRAVRWRRAIRALVVADAPPGALRTAAAARIELMPFQLEPAMAVMRGYGSRVLLADEVGLGKTIQAGLIVAELTVRGAIDRVLVLTPAGLRDQWAEELSDRYAIRALCVDGHVLRRRATELPVGVNPWSTCDVAIASIDYVKRPEVLPLVARTAWDVVVVDEAHAVAGDSERHAAVQMLTTRSACVLMLTATPHSGDRRAFAALCEVGAVDDDALLVFRRTRQEVGIGTRRRVHALHVRSNELERRMHTRLAAYSRAVRAERHRDASLALSVLHKRALSSPWSLAQSVERRLAALLPSLARVDAGAEQLALPLGDPHGDLVSADEPPPWPADVRLSDPLREQRLLDSLAAAARAAARHDTKLKALTRLVRRANEPAIVFTEYRDTLLHVRDRLQAVCGTHGPVILLHGGLGRDDRVAALDAFSRAARAVLLATDAAAEGLNLHRHCRLVINLELPWNPMRLEQRIGRVDRIGQQRTVHAFHLIAGNTGEVRILDRLRARLATARAELGAPDPLGEDEDGAIAALVVGGARDGDCGDEPAS
jgi:superfamily II DNA or RNA helicase